jgi:hypothetical protein
MHCGQLSADGAKVKHAVAAATGQTKEKRAPKGSGGSVDSSP